MSSSRRQFGKSTFKPSFGGVGASATVRGDEENLNNAIIDDEAEADLSATTAKSSAAFLNATFSSAGSSSASAENSGDTMEVEAQGEMRSTLKARRPEWVARRLPLESKP